MAFFWNKKDITKTFNKTADLFTVVDGKSSNYNWNSVAEMYEECPYVRSIIDYVALSLQNVIIREFQKVEKGEDKELYDTFALKLLKNPNPVQSGSNLLAQTFVFEKLYSQSFLRGVKGLSGGFEKSIALWSINPKDITIQYVDNGNIDITATSSINQIIKYFDYCSNSVRKQLTTDEVLFSNVSYLFDNLLCSESEFETLKQTVANLMYIQESRGVIIRNRGALGMLSKESSSGDMGGVIGMDPTDKADVLKEYKNLYGTGIGQSQVLIPNFPMRWTPMILNIKDLQLDESALHEFNKCCDLLKIPRGIFDDKTTFSNQLEIRKRLYQDAIIPYMNAKMETLGAKLGLKNTYLVADYSHVDCMQPDKKLSAETDKLQAEKLEIMYKNGVISKGTWLTEMGYIATSQQMNEYYVEPTKQATI